MIRIGTTKMGSEFKSDLNTAEAHNKFLNIIDKMEIMALKQGTTLTDMLVELKKK